MKINISKVAVKFECPVKQTTVEVPMNRHDFYHSTSPCEICGEHFELSYDFKCPCCGAIHTIQIVERKTWS